MKTLIGGSKAAKYWLGDKYWRNVKDTDYFGYSISCNLNLNKMEESLLNFLYSDIKEHIEFFKVDCCPPLQKILASNKDQTYIDLKNLLIIKNAHKYFYLGKFKKSFKHLLDYSNLLKHIQLSEEDKQLSEEYKNWLIEFAYFNDRRLIHFPKLNKTKQEFFNDSVDYHGIDHDWLHELLAIEEKPAYTKCLTGEVMFSNKLFNQLDYQSKVHMVLEESFVLALERCLIPMFKGETYLPAFTPIDAFKYSLTRVATNLTSGPFREFASDNFCKIYEEYESSHTNYYKIIDKVLHV